MASSLYAERRIAEPARVAGIAIPPVHFLQLLYIGFIFAFFIVNGVGITPELLFLLLAVGFVWRSRWRFVRDFGPIVLLLFAYDAMRGFADNIGGRVHFTYTIAADKFMFGEVPNATLQRWLYNPNQTHWYDYAASLLYMVHFLVPLVFAAILWQHYRAHYWRFVISLVVLSYAAFMTYMLLPTAPPWYAATQGYLPGVQPAFESMAFVSGLYQYLSANHVAAMPSLHAAYPWLFFLFSVRIWGWKGAPFLLYVVALDFSLVYLGHHYVIDVLAGIAFATAAYVLCATELASNRVKALWRWLQSQLVREDTPIPATALEVTP